MSNILIVGGSRGIGAAAVRAFRDNGDDVVFTYHRSELEADASSAKELWTGKICAVSDTLCAVLPPHGAAAFRLAK